MEAARTLLRDFMLVFIGGNGGLWLGIATGALSDNRSLILEVPCMLLGAGIGACLAVGAHERDRKWGAAPVLVEPEPVDEPLDTCGHDAEAVPVEVRIDEDDDGEPDIVAWLCSQCGAKVSKPLPNLDPLDGDASKVLLRSRIEELGAIANAWHSDGRDFILSKGQMEGYKRMLDEINEVKRLIEVRSRPRRHAVTTYYQSGAPTGVTVGDLWFDTDDGNVPWRWDGAGWQEVETTEVRCHGSDFPTRRILS